MCIVRSEVPDCSDSETRRNEAIRIVAIVGQGSVSPLKSATWKEVMLHTSDKLKWVDDEYEMSVLTDKSLVNKSQISGMDLLMIVSVRDDDSISWLLENTHSIPNIFCFESSPLLQNRLGGEHVASKLGVESSVVNSVSDAWNRHNSDDIRFCILVIINAYIKPVPSLKNLRAKGFSTLSCMVNNCGREVINCLLDKNCRKALQCLNACSPTDQVCSYRCIASYESPRLEAFSLCVLQKNNCLELDAEIPRKPVVQPQTTFRSEPLTHDIAEDLFVGWLGNLKWSWRVVAGQNPAYDQFPCQYQLFYRGKSKRSFWYEPVFKVTTFDGEEVWRRRKYSVRRGDVPGKFYFSVLDNGVVSKEAWTIVDVCDDLSWGLFHYSGAAAAAGQSYTGAVLVSPDGMYPPDMEGERLDSALDKCGIKIWELYNVNNSSCTNAPLGIPEGSTLHRKISLSITI